MLCFPTFFQPRHTFLEPLTRLHNAFVALRLYTRLTHSVIYIYIYISYNYYNIFNLYKKVSIKFISASLNRSLQAALSISCNFFAVCRSKKSSW